MKRYQRKQLPFKVIDDCCYIVDSFQTKSAYKLNETSMSLWIFLSEEHTFEEIIEHFRDLYAIENEDELNKDMQRLIGDMLDQSIINET